MKRASKKRPAQSPKTTQPPKPARSPRPKSTSKTTSPAKPEPAVEEPSVAEAQLRHHSSQFLIVGLGASAGGLEALEAFLRHVPANPSAAFVIVQHLDPTHKGMLPELLQRVTPLTVVEATDGTRVDREHVYVIPPNKDMSLLHGTLHLLPQASNPGRVLPIDFFFRSLAQDQGERSIGVILSGMGTDGTLGLRAIKEAAGAAFVQAPESAKFDSMPRSAIEAGLADVVVPVEELPTRILSYREHAAVLIGDFAGRHADPTGSIDKICMLLKEHSGNDFSLYKRTTIHRRIERRMGLLQIATASEYLRFLREHPREREQLFEELLIGVTSFFRDPPEWDRLRQDILPGLVSSRLASGVLRAWVAGCSTGEEAYSLAMLFREAIEPLKATRTMSVQIFATDLDKNAIEKARVGLYPENIAADVPPERLRRFFVREERGYRVSKDIRETVVFAPQNVISDPPFTKVDVVACRNLLIYLSGEVQKKLIPLFHYCLNPGGVLFLGTAETVGVYTNLFTPQDARSRLYRRLDQPATAFAIDIGMPQMRLGGSRGAPDPAVGPARPAPPNLQMLVDRLLIGRFAPLGILCNTKGDILYVSGRAGRYLEPAVGKPNVNILAMAREGLRYELSSAFGKALRNERPVIVRGIKVGTNGGTAHVNLTVQRLTEPKELVGTVIVVIADAPPPPLAKARTAKGKLAPLLSEMEEELQRAHDEAQTIREEMQSSQEELKSTNEELQSTNEELQSTNEELTTSKEEMQSLNEELQTVNHELQSKVDELSRSNNDMKNLLNSTDIATLFLDADLRVRRFTTPTSKIIKLIPADIGRMITDLASELDYVDLAEDAREVLRTLIFKEKQAVSRDGRAFTVRVMPYRTIDNVIDGVVITFTDATASRSLEIAAREQASQLRQMAESLPNLVWGARADGAFDYISKQWLDYTGVPEQEQQLWGWLDLLYATDRERVREIWRAAVKGGLSFDAEMRIRSRHGAYRWFKTRAVPIRDESGVVVKWYGTSTDIDNVKRDEDRLMRALSVIHEGVLAVSKDGIVERANPAAAALLGGDSLVGKPIAQLLPGLSLDELEDGGPDRDIGGYRVISQLDDDGGVWLFLRTT